MNEYHNKIIKCETILKNPKMCKPSKFTETISRHILNNNKLIISDWLLNIINVCCGNFPHFALVIFYELENSIKVRKFNGLSIPINYEITTDDWVECYEDGYPICSFDGCYDEYNESYISLIQNLSYNDLMKYLYNV